MAKPIIVNVYPDPRYPHVVCVKNVTNASPVVAQTAIFVAQTAEWQADGSACIPSYIDTQGLDLVLRSKYHG